MRPFVVATVRVPPETVQVPVTEVLFEIVTVPPDVKLPPTVPVPIVAVPELRNKLFVLFTVSVPEPVVNVPAETVTSPPNVAVFVPRLNVPLDAAKVLEAKVMVDEEMVTVPL